MKEPICEAYDDAACRWHVTGDENQAIEQRGFQREWQATCVAHVE